MIPRVGIGGATIVAIALIVAAVLLLLACACIFIAMAFARRDARAHRRQQPLPPAPVRTGHGAIHPLHALNQRLRNERNDLARMDLTMQLAAHGGAQAALLLVAAVRDGVIAPTAGARAVWSTGFNGGVVAGIAVHDPDPRVQAFARMVLDGAMQH
jgi:hypothetical protein